MNISSYIYKYRVDGKWSLCPVIKCKSGLKMSVQASETHYCTPRDNFGPWSHVEIGFPSKKIEELMPYVENGDDPTGTVYAYVPVEILDYVIENNGGVENE